MVLSLPWLIALGDFSCSGIIQITDFFVLDCSTYSCFSGDRDRHILVWEPGGQGAGQPENPEAVRDAWSSDDEDS